MSTYSELKDGVRLAKNLVDYCNTLYIQACMDDKAVAQVETHAELIRASMDLAIAQAKLDRRVASLIGV